MDHFSSRSGAVSLRRRLLRWIASAFAATVVVLTAVAVLEERRLVLAVESASGESFVSHLASMPELRSDRSAAAAYVATLDAPLRAAGMRLAIVPPSTPIDGRVAARRTIELADGTFELRYGVDSPWLSRLRNRSLVFHLAFGGGALVVLLLGAEWIVRRRILEPLRRFAHQIRFMRDGGGWKPKLPPSDSELADVASALEELGPALEAQVQEWLEGERRAAAARALSGLRARLREPKRRALALLGDLQARDQVTPEAKPKLRALVLEVERIALEIRGGEAELFGPKGTPRRAG